ncbi:MAG: PhzF family phenazine biosynthesis protein [Cyanobacteriota bacterium]
MTLPAVLIEAFAPGPCQGNGAAVVRLATPLADGALQAIATSLRQSETAFLLHRAGQWLLRWFTPCCEVPLCGHATLAALLALAHWGELAPGDSLTFHSRSGPLAVRLHGQRPGCGSLVLPAPPLQPAALPNHLEALLAERCGVQVEAFWTSRLGYAVALLPQGSGLEPLDGLAEPLRDAPWAGLVVMAATAPDQQPPLPLVQGLPPSYQLRFFAPALGIPEDPVTGSAHALVAPYWLARTGRSEVAGWQPSARAGGMVCSAASSGMIRLLGTGHLLWDGALHFGPSGAGPSSSGDSDAVAGWEALHPLG